MYLKEKEIIYSTTAKEFYKFHIENQTKIRIDIEEYCKIIFGTYHYRLRRLLGNSNCVKKDKIYSTHYQISELYILNMQGELIEERKNFFSEYTPYDIAVNEKENEIWVATGSGQIVYCKKIESKEIVHEIGKPYEDNDQISYPESVFIYKEDIYISEMGNKRVTKINLKNNNKKVYLEFKERVWDFQKNEFAEIVLLDSGIHKVENGKIIKID